MASSDVVQRNVLAKALEYMDAFRVVVINGPRQSGKSTILRALQEQRPGSLFELESEELLAAVRADPVGLVQSNEPYVYIDEVQLGGDALIRAIKNYVDRPNNPTTFVLAGSTNFLTVPVLSESLAGRAVFIDVWPFSQGEIEMRQERFIDALTSGQPVSDYEYEELSRSEYFSRVVSGGYPEVLSLHKDSLRDAWFESYVRTVVNRDIVELSGIRRANELPRLLTFLTGKTAQELVKTNLANEVGIERNRLDTYISLLETVFMVRFLPAWSRNPLGKVTRTAKLHACDTGMIAQLHGVTTTSLEKPIAPLKGQLLETFVHNELVKQQSWNETSTVLSHWRDRGGAEVDFILETRQGSVYGIEVKASSTASLDDFKWLQRLNDKLGNEFAGGVVFYLGARPLSFGAKLAALPVSALWRA